jgi:hypothetical protein
VSDGDFVGMQDSEGRAFQIMNEDDEPRNSAKRYRVDIPDTVNRGAWQREIKWHQLVVMVRQLPERIDPADFAGLEFRAW